MSEKKYPIKWEYKSHSYQIADTGDYDGYWEITNGKDSLITKEDYEDIEKDLQAVVDVLNNTYANFTVDRTTEAALESEKQWLKIELDQARQQQPRGAVWVKASERLPAYESQTVFRQHGNYWVGVLLNGTGDIKGNVLHLRGALHHVVGDEKIKHFEWLDESPAEQPVVSQDAHEKEVMMQAFDKVRKIFELRKWIMEGRGSYPYNDDRYKEEVRYMYDEFDQLFNDTWNNIKSKSIEYREWIIDEYLQKDHPAIHDILTRLGYRKAAEQPGREVEAIAFAEWLYKNRWFHFENGKWYYTFEMGTVMGDKSYQKNYVKSTAQLWEVFKKEGNYPQ